MVCAAHVWVGQVAPLVDDETWLLPCMDRTPMHCRDRCPCACIAAMAAVCNPCRTMRVGQAATPPFHPSPLLPHACLPSLGLPYVAPLAAHHPPRIQALHCAYHCAPHQHHSGQQQGGWGLVLLVGTGGGAGTRISTGQHVPGGGALDNAQATSMCILQQPARVPLCSLAAHRLLAVVFRSPA